MPNSCKQKQYFISLTILAGMFLYSVVSCGDSILIPYFRIACGLTISNPTSWLLLFI